MTCGCGSIHNLDCPVAEAQRRAMDDAAARAWARERRDGPTIREAKSEAVARTAPWQLEWVRGFGATLHHCGTPVCVDILNAGPAVCGKCGKADSLEAAHAGAIPYRAPHDARTDMKALLERMRRLVGEMDRLLEKSK